MNILAIFILSSLFLLSQILDVWAAPTTYILSATVPASTGISITVSSINSTTNLFTVLPAGTTALSFDPMTFNSTSSVYLPNHYYALDFGVSGGAGTADVTVSYNEGANPNGTSNGLGYKTTATFAKEVPGTGGTTTESLLAAHGKKRLIDLNAEHVAYTEVTPGFLRIYLGVWTGSLTGLAPDPSTGQPFSNGDFPGQYTGSLVVTAVVN